MTAVRARAVPVVEAATASLGAVHHVDACAVDIPADMHAVDFCYAVLSRTPRWVTDLLSVRDVLMAPFGLNRQRRVPRGEGAIEPGQKLGPFTVMTVDESEVLLGDDDKHLSFRTSFAVRDHLGGREGVCTTAVRFHGGFGRTYFRTIKPFHDLIVPRVVAHGVNP